MSNIKLSIFRTTIYSIVLLSLLGCASSRTTQTMLNNSHKKCYTEETERLSQAFEAYKLARSRNNVSQTMDSIITAFSNKDDKDTIYILESCNPPLYQYYAMIWNRHNSITLFGSGTTTKQMGSEDQLLISLIENWDKPKILEASHEKPMSYGSEWEESRIASRIILENGKCLQIETIYFSPIDMKNTNIPVLWD